MRMEMVRPEVEKASWKVLPNRALVSKAKNLGRF